MIEDVQLLKSQADEAKLKFKLGLMTYEEAKINIEPYVKKFNKRSKEIAKKYNQRAKLISTAAYLR